MHPATCNFKQVASLLGGAIGDALGAGVEFLSLREIRHRYGENGIEGYVEFADGHGEFTDDTQMTLFTAEGLLRAYHRAVMKGIGGAHASITHQSYLRWLITQGITPRYKEEWLKENMESGWLIKEKALHVLRAPGNTCLSSLKSGVMGTVDKPINNSKGCGGIMRMAPVGLFVNNPDAAFQYGCELAAITHGHPSGYLSSGVFATIIQLLSSGMGLEEAIRYSCELLIKWDEHEETMEAVNKALVLFHQTEKSGLRTSDIPELINKLGQGWVGEEALAISLFCSLLFENCFEKGVLASVNHSGDSDSTGAITGNILGLINGPDAIPEKWIRNLHHVDIVRQIAEDLATGCKGSTNNPDDEWWEKYPGY